VLTPVADFAQTQEDDAARLQTLSHTPDFLTRTIDCVAMRGRASAGLLDLACAVRDRADEARIVAGVA
jgi:hypothetical protein